MLFYLLRMIKERKKDELGLYITVYPSQKKNFFFLKYRSHDCVVTVIQIIVLLFLYLFV